LTARDSRDETRVYRCGAAARWLPRVLGGAVLVTAMLVALRLLPASGVPGAREFRAGLVVLAAVVALWVVRKGGEARIEVGVGPNGLFLFRGPHRSDLAYDEIDGLRYDAPFGASKSWVPATVLTDRRGATWRLSGFLDRGERLIEDLLELSGRDDLRAWADALQIPRRMAGSSRRVGLGYGFAALVLLTGAIFHLH
jgi:hypothetical protein